MRIINIVDRLDRVNYGVWNAATASAPELRRQFNVVSEIWFPQSTNEAEKNELNGAVPRGFSERTRDALQEVSVLADLDPPSDIIVTHGCWQYPTRWGQLLKQRGFRWMAVPHGMLEPWSLSQKRLQKWIYFHFIEKPALRQADWIRAVGRPEFDNLKKQFPDRLFWVPNGVAAVDESFAMGKPARPIVYLFMARLHHKKGIVPLVRAWLSSKLAASNDHVLKIAGPDEGELGAIKNLVEGSEKAGNIEILGPVFGEKKASLLKQSHFFILPSRSEGFPTSVLEAMQHGLIPIISPGCNFPDVFEQDLGLRVLPNKKSILTGLESAMQMDEAHRARLANTCHQFIQQHYTQNQLARKLYEVICDRD